MWSSGSLFHESETENSGQSQAESSLTLRSPQVVVITMEVFRISPGSVSSIRVETQTI